MCFIILKSFGEKYLLFPALTVGLICANWKKIVTGISMVLFGEILTSVLERSEGHEAC